MSCTKRLMEKEQSILFHAQSFLIEYAYIEEALDGTICSLHSSSENIIFINSNKYYKKNNLEESFSLNEFRNKIKHILDTSIESTAFRYDSERIK